MNLVAVTTSRTMALNPNAREFVPTTMRSSSPATYANAGDGHETSTALKNGKEILDKTGSSDICISVEESRSYWDVQLPDDILTPDDDFFLLAREDEKSASRASVPSDPSSLSASFKDPTSNSPWQRVACNGKEPQGVASISSYDFPNSHQSPPRNSWEDELALRSMGGSWNGQQGNGPNHLSALSLNVFKEHSNKDALGLLASEFPSLPVHSLAEVYQANGGDLGLTVQMLTQLKLQGDGNTWRNLPSPSHSSPGSRSLHFSGATPQGGLPHVLDEVDMHQARKSSRHWPYGRNELVGDLSLGPSNFSSTSSYRSLLDRESPFSSDDSFEPTVLYSKHMSSPQSLMESDDAIVNLVLELQEEAQNHGRMRNFYIERARQAMYAGDRFHSKEATAKGQFYNRLMKAVENKLAEIELQRNMSTVPTANFGPGHMQLIDLCGFHVNEAINVLRCELSTFRMVARSLRQQQQVLISVGTGHARGGRTPARVLFAVKRHLVEEEFLSFTELQPGVVKVVVG